MRTVPQNIAEKVLDAAEVIAERGLDNTKMEEIAAVTGIPRATLYYYFEGKEDLLSFIFSVVLDATEEAVTHAVATPGSASERLHAVVTQHISVFNKYPAACQALHFDVGRATRIPELADRVRAAYLDPVKALIVEGIGNGEFREVADPDLTTLAIFGATTTTAVHVTAVEPAADLEAVPDAIATLVLGGLLPKSPPARRRS